MAMFYESDSDTEELDIPTVVLPYQYEPAANQFQVGEHASSRDASEEEAESVLDVDIPAVENW